MNANQKSKYQNEAKVIVTWTTQCGIKNRTRFNLFDARERLTFLDAEELRTRECAPTDSGVIRFNYEAEANAIATVFGISRDERLKTPKPAPGRSAEYLRAVDALESIKANAERIAGLIPDSYDGVLAFDGSPAGFAAMRRYRKLEAIRDYLSNLCEALDNAE